MGACAGTKSKPQTEPLEGNKQIQPATEDKQKRLEPVEQAPVVQPINKPQPHKEHVIEYPKIDNEDQQRLFQLDRVLETNNLPISSAKKGGFQLKEVIHQEQEVVHDQSHLGFHNVNIPPSFVISVS